MVLIMQGDAAVYPLGVSQLKDLGDKLFGPVSTIEVLLDIDRWNPWIL
jgi:hypothetical protein